MDKRCSKCEAVKPTEEFGRRSATGDGFQVWCKPCMSAAAKARREAKAAEVRAYNSAYRAANREVCDAATARWRAANKERVARTKREWAERNPEKIRESQRRNKESRAKALAEWKAANREKVREYQRQRRLAGYGGSLRDIDTEALWEACGGSCGLCGEDIDISLAWPHPGSRSLDHVVPLSRGGEHSNANCQWAHLRCNLSKNNRV